MTKEGIALNIDELLLTATAEVGMVSLLTNEVIPFEDMPLTFVGITTCFRREAGSAGRDTRGLYRVHQFQKVEQVVICPDDEDISNQAHFALLC